MTKKRSFFQLTPTSVEGLFALSKRRFEKSIKKEIRHLIVIGALVDSGERGEDGEVRWAPVKTHPYWAHIWEEIDAELAERPPEIKRRLQ
jgi:hypothetical protein